MKDLDHRNLNIFVGAHLDHPIPKLFIWGHCEKGNLAEILFQEDIQLDNMFISSFLVDVVEVRWILVWETPRVSENISNTPKVC